MRGGQRLKDERGQSLVEMALVMFVLLLLLAGVFDVGRAFHSYIIITNAAREGARTASRVPCKADNRPALRAAIVASSINEAQNSAVTLAAGDVSIAPDPVADGCAAAGAPVRVTVTHQFQVVMGGILGFNQIPMQSSTTMVYFGAD